MKRFAIGAALFSLCWTLTSCSTAPKIQYKYLPTEVPQYLLRETDIADLPSGPITNGALLQWGMTNYSLLQQCNNDKRAIQRLVENTDGAGTGRAEDDHESAK